MHSWFKKKWKLKNMILNDKWWSSSCMDNEVVYEIKCFGQANISEYKLLEINAIIWRKKKFESY